MLISAPSVYFDGRNPDSTTAAMITYTDGRTLPSHGGRADLGTGAGEDDAAAEPFRGPRRLW
jgi:hypothetical protein